MEIDLLKLFIFLGILVIICTLIYEHEPMKFGQHFIPLYIETIFQNTF